MKIVCDACSAKYSIADEKVRGKVFKIRCKKCSNIIVVRGNAEASDGATAAFEPPGTGGESEPAEPADPSAVWHLVIDQQQVGPMAPGEVRGHLDRGEIDADSYIWREGFSDWERMADIEPFSAWFAGQGQTAVGGGLFGSAAVTDDSKTTQADPGDLFSARASQPDPGSDLFGSAPMGASDAGDGGGLFGQARASAAASESHAVGPSELKGQRSENSVLFSLNNLAALASDTPRAAPSTSSSMSSGGGGMAQHAGGEGSGLIDIRSMAQVYLGDSHRRESGAPPVNSGSIDDLPVFSQSSFESASPLLMPTAAASNSKLIVMLAGLIGVLIIAAAILIIVVVKGGGDKGGGRAEGETVAAVSPGGQDSGATAAAPASAAKAAGATTDLPGDTAAPPAGGTGDEPAAAGDRQPKAADRRTDARPKDTSGGRAVVKKPVPERATPTPSGRTSSPVPGDDGGCDEVSCLVEPDKACCKKSRRGTTSPGRASNDSGGNSDLQEKPTREEISGGIGKVRGRVQGCGDKTGGSGQVSVKIKISPSGGVDSASASGGSSALNSCVESAVRGAKFKKSQKGITVNYPFVFR